MSGSKYRHHSPDKIIQPMMDAPKIQGLLQRQKHQSIIQLSDHFIGDAGCMILGKILHNHPDMHTLELKGNEIGGPGITALCESLNKTSLKHLSLEWNNLGLSDIGLTAFFEALSESQTIQTLDLRNNRIGPQFGANLAQFIKSSKTLQSLDLRWNQIGNQGIKPIISFGLPSNSSLISLQIAGNHISEENQLKVDLFINRNREEKGLPQIERRVQQRSQSPLIVQSGSASMTRGAIGGGSHNKQNVIQRSLLQAQLHQQQSRKFKTTQTNNLMAQTQLKRMEAEKNQDQLKDREDQLQSERKQAEQLQKQLTEQLNTERQEKEKMLIEVNELKNSIKSQEMDTQKKVQTILLKMEQLAHSKRNEDVKINAIKESRQQKTAMYRERISGLEKLISEQTIRKNENSQGIQGEIVKYEKESGRELREIASQYQVQFKKIQQRLNQAQGLKQQADSENKALKKQILEIKLNYQRQSQIAQQQASSKQKREYQGSIHQLEGQLKSIQDARSSSLHQLDSVSKQADDRQSQFNNLLISKEKESQKLRQTISQLKTENQQTSLQNCKLISDLQVMQGNIQKEQSDLKELGAQIESHTISSSTQLQALYNETNNSRKASDASMFALNARIRQLEKSLIQARTTLKQKQERQNQIANEIVTELDHNVRSFLVEKQRMR